MGFFDKLKQGLIKTKNAVFGQVNEVVKSFRKVDEELLEELLLLLPEELPPFSLLLTAASVFSPAMPSADSPFAVWKL